MTNLPYQGLVFVFRFAFVEFENAEDAKEALENLNHTEIEGRSVRLEFSQNSGGRDGGRGNSGTYLHFIFIFVLTFLFPLAQLAWPDMMKT